jgi:threonine/homoserine/homoserine lactone efflux protein
MPEFSTLGMFVAAAFVLAIIPGPGMFYITGRTLAAGRSDGYASVFGTALGGLVHVIAGVVGVSALIMASTTAFMALKLIGGVYLIYLGIQTWRSAGGASLAPRASGKTGAGRAFRDGILVEATNPKTAAFFLALIPQFIDPSQGSIAGQFLVLGAISIALNTLTALAVATGASHIRSKLLDRPHVIRRIRQGSGAVLAGLGFSLLLTRRPA